MKHHMHRVLFENFHEFQSLVCNTDIFGFECFDSGNSFEQLCINFCNEKLQFFFNDHIFSMEQSVYEAEGVSVPRTDFKDNQPTLDLLAMKTTGIFPMIDNEINIPRGSDQTLLNKLQQDHGKNKSFVRMPPKKLKVWIVLRSHGLEKIRCAHVAERDRIQIL